MYLFVIWEMPLLLFGSFSLTRADDQLLPSSSLLFMVENKPFFRETGTWPWPRKWVVLYYWVESCLRRSFDKTSPFTSTRSTSSTIVEGWGSFTEKISHTTSRNSWWAFQSMGHKKITQDKHDQPPTVTQEPINLICAVVSYFEKHTDRPAPASSFIGLEIFEWKNSK